MTTERESLMLMLVDAWAYGRISGEIHGTIEQAKPEREHLLGKMADVFLLTNRARRQQAAANMRDDAATLAADFSWNLPLFESREVNIATDDAACAVCKQIEAAIRGLPTHQQPEIA